MEQLSGGFLYLLLLEARSFRLRFLLWLQHWLRHITPRRGSRSDLCREDETGRCYMHSDRLHSAGCVEKGACCLVGPYW